VVHRDLKPANIHLVTLANGARLAKLLDFGIVKLRESPLSKRLTDGGMILGTPNYMAPEQVSLEDVDARTDVYAMGATMYEALCGALPYDRDGVVATIGAILAGPPPPLSARAPHLDLELVAVVERAMSRSPADRFANAGEMRDALLALDPRAVTTMAMSAPAPVAPAGEAATRAVTPQAASAPAATVAAPRRARAPRGDVAPAPAPERDPAVPVSASSTSASVSLPMNSSRGLIAFIVIASSIAIGLFTWAAFRNQAARDASQPATTRTRDVAPTPPTPSAPPQAPPPTPDLTPAPARGQDPPAAPTVTHEPRDRHPPHRGSEPAASPSHEVAPPQTSSEPATMTSRPRVDGFIDPFDE